MLCSNISAGELWFGLSERTTCSSGVMGRWMGSIQFDRLAAFVRIHAVLAFAVLPRVYDST